jgi:hypothetical protein
VCATQVETAKLNYIRFNQEKLRSAQLKDVVAAAAAGGGEDGAPLGQATHLPSNFLGSPRYMRGVYLDAMCIVSKLGKPSLFITFTCNPAWPELIDALLPTNTASDRPDLIARVFNLKLRAFLHDVVKEDAFGKVVAWMYTIEYQKRGLPHAHICLILADSLDSAEQIDAVVSAEIPAEGLLRELVLKHKVHGPCGEGHPGGQQCLKDGKCSKGYPKQFNKFTIVGDVSSMAPQYRRRALEDGGLTVMHKGKLITNQWIVPYNARVLFMNEAHINVEVVGSNATIKYLYKYVFKGPDRAMINVDAEQGGVALEEARDEVGEFQDARYLGSIEAVWRLNVFPTNGRSPAVVPLIVHLEGEQMLLFENDEQARGLAEENKNSQLMAFFVLNSTLPPAERIKYPDIPTKYTWDKKDRSWRKRRQTSGTLGRVHALSPRTGARRDQSPTQGSRIGLPAAFELLNTHFLPNYQLNPMLNPDSAVLPTQVTFSTCACCCTTRLAAPPLPSWT